ncbi:hypothetical protein [Plenodomus lingam JN3]|uniref:CCCH zinc finger and RRM domain-containing protein n=1 Tax=Leptosphaeria maculans (strain JN3 / isolate v23.1.3 / race Av1-4-5-6-7-8) TaxID=985895 RepID=M1ZIQ1_LEPMJ|nr:hypothetical protein [Plenodomus lingam JN3]
MLLQEKDHEAFKHWVLPKLETISDADAEVLADYVLALVAGQDSEANMRRNCVESLSDFLQDYTESFVNDVIKALRDKNFLPAVTSNAKANGTRPQNTTAGILQATSHSAPTSSIVWNANTESGPQALQSANTLPAGAPRGPAAMKVPTGSQTYNILSYVPDGPRKRKRGDREAHESKDGRDVPQDQIGSNKKPMRQTAHRGGAQIQRQATKAQNPFPPFSAMAHLHNLPPPPPGPPPFDDPMAMFAIAAAFGIDLSALPPLPFSSSQNNAKSHMEPKAKCKDYHTKGFCALGTVCPYEHGNAIAVPADSIPEYDPEHASLALQTNGKDGGRSGHRAPRKRSQTSGGPQGRAEFTHVGPSHDPTNTTLVVDKIPTEKCSEDEVRGFFSTFGAITDVKMHTHKRMAIIKFKDREAAQQAYRSPKAVFDSRFVRVFWHRSHVDSPHGNADVGMEYTGQEEQRESPEEIAKRQAEAQKVFEERRRKAEEADARSAEIDRLLKEKTEEMRKIRQQLAELSGEKGAEEEGFTETLASLQAEAENLFAQYEPETAAPSRGRGTYRGSYRSRGSATFPLRGRGYAGAFRGACRGRGANSAGFQSRPSVKRLDNRPKRLAVAGVEEHSAREEALRQHLLNMPDCTSIERHPEQPTTLILTFKERYQAEMFLDESLHLSDIGKLDFSWVPNDAFGGVRPTTSGAEEPDVSDGESSATVGEEGASAEIDDGLKVEQEAEREDVDMDVADDVDQWL